MSEGSWLFFQYMYDFLEAVITSQTSKEEAYRKLEEMAKNQTETLSKLTKQVLACRALGPWGHSGGKFTLLPQYWLVSLKLYSIMNIDILYNISNMISNSSLLKTTTCKKFCSKIKNDSHFTYIEININVKDLLYWTKNSTIVYH